MAHLWVPPCRYGLSYTSFAYTLASAPTAPVDLAPLRRALAGGKAAGRTFLTHRPRAGVDGGSDAPLFGYEVEVRNTGSVDADDVVLGFLKPPGAGTGGIPRAQLFGFERVHIKAGQSARVWLYPRLDDLAQVDEAGARRAHAGEYKVSFGVESAAAKGMGFVEHKFVAV